MSGRPRRSGLTLFSTRTACPPPTTWPSGSRPTANFENICHAIPRSWSPRPMRRTNIAMLRPAGSLRRTPPLLRDGPPPAGQQSLPEVPEFNIGQKIMWSPPRIGLIDTLRGDTRWIPLFAPTEVQRYDHMGLDAGDDLTGARGPGRAGRSAPIGSMSWRRTAR